MVVWYIHGANNTDVSFNWLIAGLPDHDARTITYSIDKPIWEEVERLAMTMNGSNGYIVGHSLGGLIAVAISHIIQTKGVVTLASPFGGSEMAGILSWITPSELFKSVSPKGSFIQSMKSPLRTEVLSLVARSRSRLYRRPNDGMVTMDSQMAITGPKYIVLNTTHSEILLSRDTIHHIKEFIF